MFGIKKKLSSLIPNDARAHLQNVFTVEWEDGNKTVLVDVADTDKQQHEMELNGIGAGGGGTYGRLADDEEEDRYTRPVLRTRKSSQKLNSSSKNLPSLPSISRKSTSESHAPSSASTFRANPSGPSRYGGTNPFDGSADDYPSPQTSSSSTYTSSPYSTTSPKFPPYSSSSQNFSQGGASGYGSGQERRKAENPWQTFRSDEVDMLGGGDLGVDSPTSSSGAHSNGSVGYEVYRSSRTNPFR
ncbi:hypothetical protein B9479_007871 [Cryptococcus floricola]|uniref:Uncharacterized protein n=1 Tax=Cryptococcus floricola TaxID=2591691 RepID=A0A5D3AL88_9TREE|nr:hypothetical protein B9479_007871 [Cryptococcus floricola]